MPLHRPPLVIFYFHIYLEGRGELIQTSATIAALAHRATTTDVAVTVAGPDEQGEEPLIPAEWLAAQLRSNRARSGRRGYGVHIQRLEV